MIKAKFLSVLMAGLLAVPMAASAATVTQLIHFDDASNGDKSYTTADGNFLFDPTNFQSSTRCADATDGTTNGSCVIEAPKNGVLPTMTRETGDGIFTLDSFYFNMQGQGGVDDALNSLTVTGSNGKTFTFTLGQTYAEGVAGQPWVTFYEGADAGDPAGGLVKQIGYIAWFGDLFKDVTSITWTATSSAQVRLDCVVATFDGTTTEPLSNFLPACGYEEGDGGDGGDGGDTPEPMSLALVGVALIAAGAASRRRNAKRA